MEIEQDMRHIIDSKDKEIRKLRDEIQEQSHKSEIEKEAIKATNEQEIEKLGQKVQAML